MQFIRQFLKIRNSHSFVTPMGCGYKRSIDHSHAAPHSLNPPVPFSVLHRSVSSSLYSLKFNSLFPLKSLFCRNLYSHFGYAFDSTYSWNEKPIPLKLNSGGYSKMLLLFNLSSAIGVTNMLSKVINIHQISIQCVLFQAQIST